MREHAVTHADPPPSRSSTEAGRLERALAPGRALIPYLTAFDPTPEAFLEAAAGAAEGGARALEIGIPCSDPVADGPVIQRAHQRALASGGSVEGTLSLLEKLRAETDLPVVLFTYANPVLAFGLDRFLVRARDAGADGLLLLDCAPEEEPAWFDEIRRRGLDPVVLLSPNTTPPRAARIAAHGGGFLYVVAREGVTGTHGHAGSNLAARVAAARAASALPVAVGFGVKDHADVEGLWSLCEAAVVGSAFVRHLENAGAGDPRRAAQQFIRQLAGSPLPRAGKEQTP